MNTSQNALHGFRHEEKENERLKIKVPKPSIQHILNAGNEICPPGEPSQTHNTITIQAPVASSAYLPA